MSDATPPASFSRVRQLDQRIRPPQPVKKAQIRLPTINDIIFHRRNVPRSQYYFTSGHEHLGRARDVNDEQPPYTIPPNTHLFGYTQCWKAWQRQAKRNTRKANFKNSHSYQTLQSKDILQRLHIDVDIEAEEAEKHKEWHKMTAMTDVDPQYFTELRGRVIKDHSSLQQYVEDTREVLRTRLLAGQERDDCIRIDQQFDEEQKRLDKIKRKYRQYVAGFEEFLSKDHEESMEVLNNAEEQAKITKAQSVLIKELSKELGQVRLQVYFWEEAWRMVKMCQKFLYQVSPVSWRLEFDWIHRTVSGSSIISAPTDELFGRYKMLGDVASLDSLIELFEQDIVDAKYPELYFKEPQDLLHVFRAMEMQNLNALLHSESLAAPMTEMTSAITDAQNSIKQEIREVVAAIDDLEEAIHWEEERAEKLEAYANYLLQGVFRDLVCSESVLYLHVFVEDTYENCVAPNDANLDTFSMMRFIEKTHEELNMILDYLPVDVVLTCEKQGFRQEMKSMKEAEDAAKKLELMHRLLLALKRIMEPPKIKQKQLMWRSAPMNAKPKPIPPPPPPTDEELQYLNFFTNYCEKDNHVDFRSQLPDDFDLSFKCKKYDSAEDRNEEE